MTSFQDAPDENIEHDKKMELRSSAHALKISFLGISLLLSAHFLGQEEFLGILALAFSQLGILLGIKLGNRHFTRHNKTRHRDFTRHLIGIFLEMPRYNGHSAKSWFFQV